MVLALVLLAGAATPAFAQPAPAGQPAAGVAASRPIRETDLFSFTWIADPQVSPDGTRVAFTRVVVDEKRTGYETSIWSVETSGSAEAVRLTNGVRDSQPRWSPDGRRLAFVRGGDRGEDGKPRPAQIAVLPLNGGEAWTLTELPRGASGPAWSPDGKRLAFLSSTTPEDLKRAAAPKRVEAAGAAESADTPRESDVHVVTRAVYRSNDQGFLDPSRRQHVWVIDVPDVRSGPLQARRLTTGAFDEREPRWSPDGGRVYFLTTAIVEPYYELPTTDLSFVPASGGDVQTLAAIPMQVRDLAVSPDGRRAAFHGAVTQPVRSYSQTDTWVIDLSAGSQPRNLTVAYDSDLGDTVSGDNQAPRGGSGRGLRWAADGTFLYDQSSREGRTILVRIDTASGAVRDVTHGDQAVLDFSVGRESTTLVALLSTPVMIGDLFVVTADGSQRRLTDVNRALWSQLALTMPEELTYTSFDGRRIQAWVQKPPDFDSSKKYPLILNIHGGPHTAYGWVFDHEFQWMAAKGYVVLYPNPRGSTSYGQEFGNIIQYRYPGDDYRDLVAGVDELVKRGYIDTKKLGVTGGSGGGVLTNWTVTQTDRFAAAVSQRDISSWSCWWYTADFTMFQPSWFKTPPFQGPQDYANRSAITFVEKIRTPMLFVLGEEDSRTPPECGGEQLFRALKFLKRPTAMVLFPRETHELSRSGEPWHRIERLRHIVHWFDKWLAGAPHPEYRRAVGLGSLFVARRPRDHNSVMTEL